MRSSLVVLCFVFIGCVRGIIVEERLSELERIIKLQAETLSQHESLIREHRNKLEIVQHENYILRNRVEVLENALEHQDHVPDDDIDVSNNSETEDDQQVVSEDVLERRDSSIQRGKNQINQQDKPQRRLALPLASSHKVAFYAHALVSLCLNNYARLVFGVEDIDIGNGYDKNTGIYVVPVTGTYVFTWTVITSDYWYMADIMVNGQSRGKASADSYDDGQLVQGTGLLVTNVVAGDRVLIRRSAGHPTSCVDSSDAQLTTFAGWLLF